MRAVTSKIKIEAKIDHIVYCIYQLREADKHLMQIKTDNLEQMLMTETPMGPSLKVLSRI